MKRIAVLLALAALPALAAPGPIDVGNEKQLFIDDLFFQTASNVTLRVHPPIKTNEKTLEREMPWEGVTLNWFTVLEDPRGAVTEGARYRMWYECYDVDGWPTGDDTSFCYAESKDGIEWFRLKLPFFEYKGATDTNILFRMIGPEGAHSRVHGSNVFIDRKAPKDQRYKAVSQGIYTTGTPPHRVTGMVSPDGLRWTRYGYPICDMFADSQYSGFWDDAHGEYVIYGRVGGRGRSIGRSQSSDFDEFAPLELVLQTTDEDPADSDLYNPAAMKYPYAANAYFMFTSLFQHGPQTLDVRMAVSRDGIQWTWPDRATPHIPLGDAGAFDSGSIYMGQGMLSVGDEVWQYYGGSPLRHDESKLDVLTKPGNSRTYSRVVNRMDGFVSADTGAEDGFFVTPPLLFQGNILKLNVDVRDGGAVRVGLLDESGEAIPGRSVEDCTVITGDHIDTLVRWGESGDVTKWSGTPTRLRVELKNASLYAFRFAVGYAEKGRDH